MLFRFTVALFVLVNSLPSPSLAAGKGAAGGSEVTVVGPTDDTAAFIAVRTPMQPQISPMAIPATEPQPEPQAEQVMMTEIVPEPTPEEPPMQQDVPERMIGRGEMITGMPRNQQRMMERLENLMRRPDITTNEREMLRGIVRRMRGRWMRGRRLYRRAGTQETTGTTRVTVPTPETPPQEPPTIMERPTTVNTAVGEIMINTERPAVEQPMTTPETEQVTPAASELSVRGARFNKAVGEIEINNAMLGREEGRTVPRMALRDVDFNTFVGRLRAQRTELGRGEEPRVWRRRFEEWMPRRRFEWTPRRRFVREFVY